MLQCRTTSLERDTLNRSFRTTGMTQHLIAGVKAKTIQRITNHEVSQAIALYDRRFDVVDLSKSGNSRIWNSSRR